MLSRTFLAFGLFFVFPGSIARKNNTDPQRQGALRTWSYVQFTLFVVFTVLFFLMPASKLLFTIYGVLYIVSLIAEMVITIQMRNTVETL